MNDNSETNHILDDVLQEFHEKNLVDNLVDLYIENLGLKDEHFFDITFLSGVCPLNYMLTAFPGDNIGDSVWEYLSLKSIHNVQRQSLTDVGVYLTSKSYERLKLLFKKYVYIMFNN